MSRAEVLALLESQREELRQRYSVVELALFGSVARDEMREGSDVDVLVDFHGPATFDGYMDLKFFLEKLLGARVDLVTRKGLRKELRSIVEKEAIRVA